MSALSGAVVPRHNVNFFQLTLADEQHKGFYGRDASSQTTDSEIIELQQMTKDMKRIVKESAYIKRELTLARQSLQAEYEAALERKTRDLYQRCNESVNDLNDLHEERVSIIRRSFKQQLSDALISISNQNMEDLLGRRQPPAEKKDTNKEKLLELKLINEQLEKQIAQLNDQLEEAQLHIEELTRQLEAEANAPKISQEDMDKLEDEIVKLRDIIKEREDELSRAAGNAENMKRTIKNHEATIDRLNEESAMNQQEIDSLQKKVQDHEEQMKHAIEKMKAQFEKEMADEIERAKAAAIEKAKAEFEQQRKKELEEYERLKSEIEGMEKNFKAHLAAKDKAHKDSIAGMRRTEKNLRAQLAKIQKDLDYQEKAWAKRFDILQASNQEIRSETATRGAMKRYVLKMKHAEVVYRTDDPYHYLPPPQSAIPLPEISAKPSKEGTRVKFHDDASMTLSYDSEQNLPLDEFDQQQIDLDREGMHIIQAYIPLPSMDQE